MSSPVEAWNNMTTLDAMASQYYRPDLAYHPYPHALDVADRAVAKADEAMAHGVVIDQEPLPIAGRFHDAGKHLMPNVDYPFATQEEYAAKVSERVLREKPLKAPEPLIVAVGGIIRSSSPHVRCSTDTERCFVQADLAAGGIEDRPIVFLSNTYDLYRERRQLKGQAPFNVLEEGQEALIKDLVEFGAIGHEVLLAFLEEDLSTGDHDASFNAEAMKRVNLLKPKSLDRILHAYLGDIIAYSRNGKIRDRAAS